MTGKPKWVDLFGIDPTYGKQQDAKTGALDPAAIMAEHHSAGDSNECVGDNYDCGYMWPCPTYRLAEELQSAQDGLAGQREVIRDLAAREVALYRRSGALREKVADLQAELDRGMTREQMQAALSRITGPAGRHIRSGEPAASVLGTKEWQPEASGAER